MKIFSAEQTRAWDAYTIAREPVASIDLMERAAGASTRWLLQRFSGNRPFVLLCGKGNNGGDGLAIARLLIDYGRTVSVVILDSDGKGSNDFLQNLARLQQVTDGIELSDGYTPLRLPPDAVIVDALFGTGLEGPLRPAAAALVEQVNAAHQTVVSIDLPSGLQADAPGQGPVLRATHSLSFGAPKLGQLLQQNGESVGELHVLDIGLAPAYADATPTPYEFVDDALLRHLYRPRRRFAHKGTFGHALLAAGAFGKMGAAVLAASACLRGGTGLLSCHCPAGGGAILQSTLPEAMLVADVHDGMLTALPAALDRYTAIGIGPGIGTAAATIHLLEAYLRHAVAPLVIDADALNILAHHPELLGQLPKGSILTPHPKEFDRLFGPHDSDFDRISTALDQAQRRHAVILLKGHHTFIATPSGRGFFNGTGNAGMAKGGSGDVLTGLLTALRAQGYNADAAAILGVWLHGKAGDIAVQSQSPESLLPSDLVAQLGAAFRCLQGSA